MSYIFVLSDRESVLSNKIYPPIILEENDQYVMGLIDFVTYNTIPNVDEHNNMFYINGYEIEIPEGSYEVKDIAEHIQTKIQDLEETKEAVTTNTIKKGKNKSDDMTYLNMKSNNNTLKCEISSNRVIYFEKTNNIGTLLGFKPKKLQQLQKHVGDFPVNINRVNSICVECNLVSNSFKNESQGHIIHMFYPNVPPGYKIVEIPTNVIYLPVNSRYIDEICVKIVDQDGNLVNFQKEVVTVRLHLKKL